MKRIKHGEHGEHSENLGQKEQVVFEIAFQENSQELLILRSVRSVRRG